MKNIHILILCILSAGLTACGTRELQSEIVERRFSSALTEGSADSLCIDIMIEWPTKGLPAVSMQNIRKNLSSAIFGKEYTSTDPNEAIDTYIRAEETVYRQSAGDLREIATGDAQDARFSWNELKEGRFLKPYMNMQSYVLYTYGYSGGAHGIDNEEGFTFDLSDGKRIHEADLFVKDYKKKLSEILSERLRNSLSKEDYEMLFIQEIDSNDNFYVDTEGVTYIYGRYEIGPYVSGIIRVSVPWSDLKDILR